MLGFFFEFPFSREVGASWFELSYHGFFALLTLGGGVGLLRRQRWGYRLVLLATAVYTFECLFSLVGSKPSALLTLSSEIAPDAGLLDAETLRQATLATTGLIVLSWWSFAGYLVYRRDYFD